MGLRSLEDGYVPPILDVSKLDRKLLVSNAESLAGVRALVDAGGDLRRALVRARSSTSPGGSPTELDEGVVVCVLADGGWKYLSADFWDARRRRRGDGARPLVVVPAALRRELERARGRRRRRTRRAA